MKRFLISNPTNQRWIDAQEQRNVGESDPDNLVRLVRWGMFPELHLQTLQPVITKDPRTGVTKIPSEIFIEALQRQFHRRLMKELQ